MDRLNPGMQQEGWVNDLNGLIYYDGEYHLFAQRWAKCWIHAVSRDLVHWTELEPAFWEEKAGSGVQSGTCVVDYANTSGLSPSKATPPLIAFFPRWDNRSQCISYSLDHGRTWKFNEKNPILVYPERDPKVFWYFSTAIFGFVAVVCLLSTIERLVKGASFLAVQTLIGILTLLLAGLCLRQDLGRQEGVGASRESRVHRNGRRPCGDANAQRPLARPPDRAELREPRLPRPTDLVC
jgi:hypothetical protein